MRKIPTDLRRFLAAFDPHISRLFFATRSVILAVAPEANELIYNAYNTVSAVYSFSDKLRAAFCHVAAYSAHVNLGFNHGADLPDPARLLVGAGAHIRHIRIVRPADLDAPAIHALIRVAADAGRRLVPQVPERPTAIVRPTTGPKRRPTRPIGIGS